MLIVKREMPMPELPEVETVKRGLTKLLVGHKVVSVNFDWPKSFPNANADVDAFLIGAHVTAVRRRAKVLMIDLDTGYSLVIHLKMTGQLVYVGGRRSEVGDGEKHTAQISKSHLPYPISNSSETRFGAGHPNESLVGKLPDKSTRVTLGLDNGAHLFFNDQRKFGWMRLMPTIAIPELNFFKKVGPEPLESNFSAEDFIVRLMRRKNSGIKAVLLDQTVIAGVGNIYADESLWGAKIHPSILVKDISTRKLRTLYTELRYVLNLAIEKGGSTDKNYVNAEGKKGSYMDFARVFRREKLPCPRCGTIIEKTRVAGRGTHTCPKCQTI